MSYYIRELFYEHKTNDIFFINILNMKFSYHFRLIIIFFLWV